VFAGDSTSGGHVGVVPVQLSAASQVPPEARHTWVAGASASVGQVTSAPLHVSAGSQSPLLVLHTCTTPATLSVGHAADVPVQFSATSQAPALPRHTVVAAAKVSAGQLGVPLHFSATSQPPAAAGRQVTVAPRFVQVPLAEAPCATEHAWQSPVQALLQQKPSTQLPVPHCAFRVQAVPWVSGVRHFRGFWVVSQKPPGQSVSMTQEFAQAVPPPLQAKGAQL
jgi:hypothetical protein